MDGAFVFRIESADEGARVLHGVTIFERDPAGRLLRRNRASRAELVGKGRWRLLDAEILTLDPAQPAVAGVIDTHAEIELELGNRRALLSANPDLLPIRDLVEFAAASPEGSAQQLEAKSLFHQRLSNPLASFPFVVLAVALGLRVEHSRSLARSAVPVVLAVLAFLMARHYAELLSLQGVWPAALGAWGSLAVFLIAALDQMRRVPR